MNQASRRGFLGSLVGLAGTLALPPFMRPVTLADCDAIVVDDVVAGAASYKVVGYDAFGNKMVEVIRVVDAKSFQWSCAKTRIIGRITAPS